MKRFAPLFALAIALTSVHASAAGALATLTPEIAKGLGAVPAGAVVVVAPLVSDQTANKAEELAVRVGAQLAGKLGASVRVHPQVASLGVARAIAGRSTALVFVQLEIAKGELRATADVYPVLSNGWDRIRNPAPPPKAHAFASAPIDAEVRSFLPPVTLEQAALHKAKLDEPDLVALGCGDTDADGGLELVVVSRARVQLGRLRGGKFVASRSAAWSTIASRWPVPMREPLGGAFIVSSGDRKGHVLLGTTDRGGVEVDETLAARAPLSGIPVTGESGGGCAGVSAESATFDGLVLPCVGAPARDATPLYSPPAAKYDAFAGADLVGRDGVARPIVAAREPGGKLRLRRGDAQHTIDGAGAQIAVGDLDQDGVPEIIASSDGSDDAITVWSWDGAQPRQRLKLPAPAGVRAIAVCPPEVRGVPALVAAVGSEVWVVR